MVRVFRWLGCRGIFALNGFSVFSALTLGRYTPYPYAYVTINSYLALSDTQHGDVFQVLSSDTRAMGRFLDIVWAELSAPQA